ncbi:GTP pyrophosphokinase [Cupriavidus gilardii]|uniref:GTP pyrophosphokinase n=1 Tax=Cupriavidus gilardii TaxID=82541 RepID=UPI001EE61D75|nr:RelA/SpoT domain-containing protein [Cupriavidus gilardii]MCG5262450.1 RelA/SpoT domain-containing protein [Cupriavidus gilardii]
MTEQEFLEKWNSERASYEAWGGFISSEIHASLEAEGIDVVLFLKIPAIPRLKSDDSLLGKAFHRGKNYDDPYRDIQDKVGIRFVVLLTSHLREIERAIEANANWSYSLDKDFEEERASKPLEFAYQSKHYVVKAARDLEVNGAKIAAGTPCEIQIRTLLQHAHSELTHDTIYKPRSVGQAGHKVHRTVAKSMALIEAADDFFVLVFEELEKATQDERNALRDLTNIYEEIIGITPSADKTNVLVLQAFKSKLGEGLRGRIYAFIERHGFVIDLIRERSRSQYIYRQPWILLAYQLVFSSPRTTKANWPLTADEIRPLFVDLAQPFD